MDGSKKIKVFDVALIASLTAILFVQEQLLTFIPGVQLTVFLMILYSRKLGLLKASLIIIIHVILDNLFMNSFSLFYTPTMLIGWLIIPITLCTIFKKVNSSFLLALLGVIYSFVYCWLYIIPNFYFLNIGPIEYFLSDIFFEVILAVCSFISIIVLYKPCSKVLDLLEKKYHS
ncbi:MAG: hypothetical protein ACI35S_09970 [Anaeroplasma sp.]